jgi:hypothetical protein
MLSQDLRVDTSRAKPQPPRHVKAEAQTVEICAGAENVTVAQHAHHIG